MNWIKRLWRKLFEVKTGAHATVVDRESIALAKRSDPKKVKLAVDKMLRRPAYDPSEDPEKVMSGEIESYFDS